MILFHAGDLGTAVARRLKSRRPDVCSVEIDRPGVDPLPLITGQDAVLVVTWRPYDALCRAIDDACFAQGVPWLVVEMTGTTMVASPRFTPGTSSGCYHCLVARNDAHTRQGDRIRALRQAYDADPALGPAGHSGPMAALALAGIEEALGGHRDGGWFRHIDVVSGTVLESRLIALHDCPRCRPATEQDRTARFTRHLAPELEGLLA